MGKLPHANQAVVPEAKINEYLLSLTHPDGRDKAVFFMAFGFSSELPEQFEDALLQHAASHEVVKSISSVFGVRYVMEGEFMTPDGRNPDIRSVWFIEIGEEFPRLVTAYPL